jgi:hypothetical protein
MKTTPSATARIKSTGTISDSSKSVARMRARIASSVGGVIFSGSCTSIRLTIFSTPATRATSSWAKADAW